MTEKKRPRALVTGASSGIGVEFARLLAEQGHDLVITARREDRLNELAEEIREAHGVEVEVVPADLGDPDAPLSLFEKTEGEGKPIDVLINNAGFGTQGTFTEIPWERTQLQMQLNLRALTELTWRYLNVMQDRKSGYILNVASIGAFLPIPSYATYGAGKAYVRNFTEAVAAEAQGSGVKVTVLCPGPTTTEFTEVAGHGEQPPGAELLFMSARRCAQIGLGALFGWRTTIVSGYMNAMMMFGLRFLPRWLMAWAGKATMSSS